MSKQEMKTPGHAPNKPEMTRRNLLKQGSMLTAAGLMGTSAAQAAEEANGFTGKAIRNGNINQSIVKWCFADYWDIESQCRIAKQLGLNSVELVDFKDFEVLKKHGLTCAIVQIDMAPNPPFLYGFCNRDYHDRVIQATREAIDAAADYGYTRVICFTGFKYKNPEDPNSPVISAQEGKKNFVDGMKKIIGHAEKKGITMCLEQLNTRDESDPMKGHPGYLGDDIDYCAELCRAVGSPNMKLLYDIYHVQIMNGDLIRRIRQHKDFIAHIHVAGNPGRGELDDNQEVNYTACMKALLDIGYDGFVGQEFIPTREPLEPLRQAVQVCDV